MSELNTFGAVMAFAIQMEADLRTYYETAGNHERALAAEKRQVKLERIRRENVLEITLEPIEGLNKAQYALGLTDVSVAGQQVVEQRIAQFYLDAAPRMNVLAVQRAFDRLAQEHLDLSSE